MSFFTWLGPLLAYLALAVFFWRRFAWRIAWKEAERWSHRSTLDDGNLSLGIFLGGLQALAWPIVLFALRGVRTEAFYGFLREPHKSRKQAELEQRDQRIAELEKERPGACALAADGTPVARRLP